MPERAENQESDGSSKGSRGDGHGDCPSRRSPDEHGQLDYLDLAAGGGPLSVAREPKTYGGRPDEDEARDYRS